MQKTDGAYRFLVLQRISHVFKIAEQAVGFDRQGDYAKAVSLYSVCSTLLSAELNVQRVGAVHMNRRGTVAVVRR